MWYKKLNRSTMIRDMNIRSKKKWKKKLFQKRTKTKKKWILNFEYQIIRNVGRIEVLVSIKMERSEKESHGVLHKIKYVSFTSIFSYAVFSITIIDSYRQRYHNSDQFNWFMGTATTQPYATCWLNFFLFSSCSVATSVILCESLCNRY